MKTQDLLLVALVVGGLYFLTRKKKGGVAKKSESSGGGGGGGIGGGMPQPIGMETNEIDVNITDLTANTPSMSACIKNPDMVGCENVLPILATAEGKEIALGDVGDGKGGYTSGLDIGDGGGVTAGMGSGGYDGGGGTSTGGLGGTSIDRDDIRGIDTKQTDIKTYTPTRPAKLPPTKPTKPVASPVPSPTKPEVPTKRFTGDRADGYYAEEVSRDRRKGRKDKFDFDGEYGTFVDDSF